MWVRQVQAGLPARSLLHPSDPANAVEADSNPWPTAAVSPFVQAFRQRGEKGMSAKVCLGITFERD